MRKLKALKVRGVQGEEKNKGKKCVLWVGKLMFLLAIFSLFLFFCTSKRISKAWGNTPITFEITSKWSTDDEDLKEMFDDKVMIDDEWVLP